MKQLLKFMVLYASGLGTFCLYFFGVLALEPTAPLVGVTVMGLILGFCAIMGALNIVFHIEEKLLEI
jgi:hypothetical protein